MLNYYAENYHSLISKPLCNGISLMAYQKLSKTQPQENTRTLKKLVYYAMFMKLNKYKGKDKFQMKRKTSIKQEYNFK